MYSNYMKLYGNIYIFFILFIAHLEPSLLLLFDAIDLQALLMGNRYRREKKKIL